MTPRKAFPIIYITSYLSPWAFYFELKIAFVIWLLSPYTKGSSVLYRKFVHPTLSNKEKVCPYSASQPAPQVKAAQRLQPHTFLALPVGVQGLKGPGRTLASCNRQCLCPGVNKGKAGPGQQVPPLTSSSFPSNPSGDRRVHHTGPRQEL